MRSKSRTAYLNTVRVTVIVIFICLKGAFARRTRYTTQPGKENRKGLIGHTLQYLKVELVKNELDKIGRLLENADAFSESGRASCENCDRA
jgi:hypothetical protein